MPAGGLMTAGLIAGGLQTGLGLYQNIRAGSLRKKAERRLEENPYMIPESATRAVNRAGSLSQGTRMAGQSQLEENLGAGTAQSIAGARRAAQTPSQILASTVASYSQKQAQQKQLDLAAEQDWQRRQESYTNAIASLSPYETKRWEYSSLYPSQANFNAASGMQQTGMANIGQGISSSLSTFANAQYLKNIAPQTQTTVAINPAYNNAPSMGMQPMTQLQPLRTTGVTFGGG